MVVHIFMNVNMFLNIYTFNQMISSLVRITMFSITYFLKDINNGFSSK